MRSRSLYTAYTIRSIKRPKPTCWATSRFRNRERPAQDGFEDEEEQVPAVQHGDRQEIEEEEVDADHRGEECEARDALTRLLARRDGDLDRAADVLPVELTDHDLVESRRP